MRKRFKSLSRSVALGAMLAGSLATSGLGQVDPFAGLLGAPAPAGNASPAATPPSPADILAPAPTASQPGSRVGFIGVEQSARRNAAGALTHGVVSMTNLRVLPDVVAPIPISLRTWNTRHLAGKPRIAVPSYILGAVRQSEVRASGAGNGTEMAQRASKISTVLVGVDDEMLLRLADEAYADLLKRLTDAGFDVVSHEELAADPDFAKIRQIGRTDSGRGNISLYAPQEAPLIAGNPLTRQPLSMAGAGINLSSASATLGAVMLQPYLAIDYASLEGSGSRVYSGTANVSAEVKFRITEGGMSFIYGQRRGLGSGPAGTVTCRDVTSNELFALMFEVDDRSDDVGVHNAFASLGMGSIYRQSKYYGVEVAPHRYEALVRAAFQGLNQSILSEIQQARA